MESSDLDLDKVFEISRFDYSQWMERSATEDEGGCAAIQSLLSTYDIFSQYRNSGSEGADSMATYSLQQWWSSIGHNQTRSVSFENCRHAGFGNVYGQSPNYVDAGMPALGFDYETKRYHREGELTKLNDGRMTATDFYENIGDDYEDIVDNCTSTGTGQAKPKKRGGRRHKSHLMKKPMALTEVIVELLDSERRENALRCLSGHLIERREKDVQFCRSAAFQLYFSCSTLAILIQRNGEVQEVISVYARIYAGDLNVRGSKRLANVLTCFQSIASSDDTRIPFVRAKIPNLLQPFILSKFTEEVYENIRAISLSVIDLICKDCEREVIQWALESDTVQDCLHAIEIGSRLSKLIAMSILESILHDERALEVICSADGKLIMDIVKMLSYLAAILGVVQDFSRRLIFLVVRCYTLLCQHPRALELVKDNFPQQLQDRTFHELKKVYPLFRTLQHQLLLCIGKVNTLMPHITPDSDTVRTPSTTTPAAGKENLSSTNSQRKRIPTPISPSTKPSPRTPRSQNMDNPLRPLDLNKEDWYRLPHTLDFTELVLTD